MIQVTGMGTPVARAGPMFERVFAASTFRGRSAGPRGTAAPIGSDAWQRAMPDGLIFSGR
ncbi:hypothetical protein BL254_15775 [Protofrankia sp. BMG5.30]|nr:hypothetical protein BL254_15775 [Protofrankia sp. BMG5.30]